VPPQVLERRPYQLRVRAEISSHSAAGLRGRWLCCSLLTYRTGYASSLVPRQRAWGSWALCGPRRQLPQAAFGRRPHNFSRPCLFRSAVWMKLYACAVTAAPPSAGRRRPVFHQLSPTPAACAPTYLSRQASRRAPRAASPRECVLRPMHSVEPCGHQSRGCSDPRRVRGEGLPCLRRTYS
jgi:hypothetical protein